MEERCLQICRNNRNGRTLVTIASNSNLDNISQTHLNCMRDFLILLYWASGSLQSFSVTSLSMPDLESKNSQARCNVEKPILACINVPSKLFHKCYEHPDVFPVFVNPCGVCLPGSVCRSAGVPEGHIYWCFQESILLYLSLLHSYFYENAGDFSNL